VTTLLQYGHAEPPPKPLALRAGPLTAIFEPHTGFLRYVRLGDHEVVRAIYGAIRDHNWASVPPQITSLNINIAANSFQITFEAHCRSEAVDYVWHGRITGEPDGKISFSFDGESRSSFQRNRIGLCVHHPITECSGRPVVIERVDGSEVKSGFPRGISPNQLFVDVRAIRHEIATTGVSAEIRFAGDSFEMEDQRNWTDASFKTYSTPLRLPAPVDVQPDDRVAQSVTVSLKNYFRPTLPVLLGRAPQLSIATTPVLALPPLGLCMAGHGQALTPREIERLRALKLSHLRVDLDLGSADYVGLLRRADAEAQQLGVGLHVALALSENAVEELRSLQPHFAALKSKVLLWLAFPAMEGAADEKLIGIAQAAVQQFASGALLAAGTRQFFADVNRSAYKRDNAPFICYSINPQVHHSDLVTLVENIAGQAYTVETSREFSSKPVTISPIALKSRFNPDMTLTRHGADTLPGDVDPRQMSLFGAGWTLGSIARLAATANVHSLTYYETTGWHGVMESETGSEKFPSRPGGIFPVYHLLADIGEFPTRQVHPTHSSHPLSVEGLTLFDGQRRKRILVASYSAEPLEVKIKTGTCKAKVRYLDETNAVEAMEKPEEFRAKAGTAVEAAGGKIELRLLPFALSRVDIE
jgi:hypothetical protein